MAWTILPIRVTELLVRTEEYWADGAVIVRLWGMNTSANGLKWITVVNLFCVEQKQIRVWKFSLCPFSRLQIIARAGCVSV